jgi:phosphoribosylamine--glycine ligase
MEENIINTDTKKKILIVGNSAREYSIAKKLSKDEKIGEIFVAPGNVAMKEFATVVDIRENAPEELINFAMENSIDLTIASGENAIKSNIADIFQSNGKMIFAPTAESAQICTYKSAGKRFMYKNHVPCTRFGIFDKQNMASDYVKKSQMPIVVKTDEHQGEKGTLVCQTEHIANDFIEDLYDSGETRVIIEDYVSGHEFSFYVVTDGYRAIPLGSVANYKYSLDGNGGLITPGMGAYTPDYKITKQIERKVLQQIIYPTLNALEKMQTPYVGIFGVDCILTGDERIYAIEFNSFMQDPDCESILEVLDENLYDIMEACAIGSFADDYEKIEIADKYAVSCVLSSGRKKDSIISGLDALDEETSVAHFNTQKNQYLEYLTNGGRTIVLTRSARTLSRALNALYEEVDLVKFDGKKFRKDIGKN